MYCNCTVRRIESFADEDARVLVRPGLSVLVDPTFLIVLHELRQIITTHLLMFLWAVLDVPISGWHIHLLGGGPRAGDCAIRRRGIIR